MLSCLEIEHFVLYLEVENLRFGLAYLEKGSLEE